MGGPPLRSLPVYRAGRCGNSGNVVLYYRMRGPRCTACFHPEVAEINAALASGAPLIATAAKFGLSRSALARHRTGCLAPKLAAAAKMVFPASATRAPVERARAIVSGRAEAAPADVLTLQPMC